MQARLIVGARLTVKKQQELGGTIAVPMGGDSDDGRVGDCASCSDQSTRCFSGLVGREVARFALLGFSGRERVGVCR